MAAPNWKQPGIVAGGAVLLVALVGAIVFAVQNRTDVAEARDGLKETQAELSVTEDALRAANDELVIVRSELLSARALLDLRTSERDQLSADLDTAQGEVRALRGDLTTTRSTLQQAQGSLQQTRQQVGLQTGQINTLKTCLSGVSQALDYASSNRWPVAQQILQAVQGSCQQSAGLF